MRSKFYGITYPVFGLSQLPFDYSITTDTIKIQKKEFDKWYEIDKYDKDKTLLQRYVSLANEEKIFDYTCLNISNLISKPIKWAIDAKGKIYNLKTQQTFKAKNVPVVKCRNTAIWVYGISYPFEIRKTLINKKEILNQYATVVYIDNIWVLYKFTTFKEPIVSLTL